MNTSNKTEQHQKQFFQLLRLSMGVTEQKDFVATDEDWQWLHEEADRQSLTGIIYGAVAQLPASQQPPMELLIQWICEADVINGKNELLNQESARLTRLFSEQGRKTAILKGQANARLYPDKFARQPGDIDIWVEGGRDSVINLLVSMGLLDEIPTIADYGKCGKATKSDHDVRLPTTKDGIVVEVHYRPSSGTINPFTNKRQQLWLNAEIMNTEVVEEGFNVPSMKFNLMMQLAHIHYHFFELGIGLRQVCDYFMLLKNSSEEDRWMVSAYLKSFGLRETAGALMWVLGEVLQLDSALMLCEPDSYRGEWMLREIMEGGNFGQYAQRRHQGIWRETFAVRLRHLRMMRFNFQEVFWLEANYWKNIIQTLPERIRRHSFSLDEHKQTKRN